ncbi:DUF547 domain-containing protein [Desulfopila aestuarii]|uniref:DUF547 domain-containing protein n=1 Tax=Desulfopila aestuarii DSM 18488 TaxID=1121416 RepID=A0A1M7YHZ8_9BACT|nr:DUF547 domain-containing protein [Desulfopila aestuarii]SHO52267.1 Protein of unknown function, DUF547 [Desulfopila aestuarii DSM 18488]
MIRTVLLIFTLVLALAGGARAEFNHKIWDNLLQQHVRVINGGKATQVDYRGLAKSHSILTGYLDTLSAISQTDFDTWPKSNQLAFLINAYNGWTVELILSRYPDLTSIKDLGSLFQSPWKKKFIPLFGKQLSLDDIEHGLIRGSGRYNDPRIHFAVNCASIGCPALKNRAYRGEILDQQLEEATTSFLTDRSRNRLKNKTLEVSSIFKWYRDDFEKGWRQANTLGQFFALYGESLGLDAETRKSVAAGRIGIDFLDYDWQLNDVK